MRNSEYIAFYQRGGGGAATLRLSVVPDHQLFATGIFVKTLTEKIIVVENAAPSDSIAFLKHRVHDIEGGAFLPSFLLSPVPRVPPAIPSLLPPVPPSACAHNGAALPSCVAHPQCMHDAVIPSFFDLYNYPPSHRHSTRPTAADLLW